MINWLIRKLTKKYSQIPLFVVTFNLQKYKDSGGENSCEIKLHPYLKHNEYIIDELKHIIDYIRRVYCMEALSK